MIETDVLDSVDRLEIKSILYKLVEKYQGEVIDDECIESVFLLLGFFSGKSQESFTINEGSSQHELQIYN